MPKLRAAKSELPVTMFHPARPEDTWSSVDISRASR